MTDADLIQQIESRDAEIARLREELAALRARVAAAPVAFMSRSAVAPSHVWELYGADGHAMQFPREMENERVRLFRDDEGESNG